MDLYASQLGPEFFLFASGQFSNAWASEGNELFDRDQTNNLNGALGVGMRYQLNVWKPWTSLRKKRLEYQQLRRKENYATRGLLLQLDQQWAVVQRDRGRVESSARSQRAAEAWLKGAAMKYDIDPSEGKGLIKAFQAEIKTRTDWSKAVLDYNISVAKLYRQVGWTPEDARRAEVQRNAALQAATSDQAAAAAAATATAAPPAANP